MFRDQFLNNLGHGRESRNRSIIVANCFITWFIYEWNNYYFFKSSGKIPVKIEWLRIAAEDDAIMSAESLNSLGRILSCPAASQIRLAEARQPPVATNLIIYDITRLNSLINTLKYQLLVSAMNRMQVQILLESKFFSWLWQFQSIMKNFCSYISQGMNESPQSCLATSHIKGCFPLGKFA